MRTENPCNINLSMAVVQQLPILVLLYLVVFLLTAIYVPRLQVNPKPHNNITDLASLLSFKQHVVDPEGVLSSNWIINSTTPSFCSWIGVRCSRRHQHRVVSLVLRNVTLQGTISPHLGNLSFLSTLLLSNNALIGSIPHTLGNLFRLQLLVLQLNYLSGPIPSALFNMSSLNIMYLYQNNLTGSLPLFSNNTCLFQEISLERNQLSGQIPSSFSQCLDLQLLALNENTITGIIPAELGYLPKLTELYLGFNHLTGEIPTSLSNLTMLQILVLVDNILVGGIPKELGNLPNLKYLELGINGLSVSIPLSLSNVSTIQTLSLSYNKLTGYVLATFGESMPLLQKFNMAENEVSGSLDFITSLSNCINLAELDIGANQFDGFLPSSIGNLSMNLRSFFMDDNHIKGIIPSEIGNLSGILDLQMTNNELKGPIPPTVYQLLKVQKLYLDRNSFVGSISSELGQMTNLGDLYFRDNKLSGEIPDSLGNLTNLRHLSLGGNTLSSNIPEALWRSQNLIELNLSRNSLAGSIPPAVGNLNMLDQLDLSENRLLGNITDSLGKLQMLTYLDLSNNYFHGQIPQSLGGLISIQYLNLSKNSLSGAIPNSLSNLRYLVSLNLSFNKLQGPIPKGRVFSNKTTVSLEGNPQLCGAPQLGFPPCSATVANSHVKENLRSLKYILPSIAFVVIVFSIFLVICATNRRRKLKTTSHTNLPQLNDHRHISYHEIVRATNNFNQDNLIGKGSFGSVFKGCLDDGLTVAVKVINMDVAGASESFETECRALCTLRHRNLIKIISVCFNLDFKALILPFMSNGNLERWLYSENYYLSLLQRLDIIIDVASALEYLHHHHPHVVLHCDLKPSNILLDEEMVAHITDFGIAKLLLADSRSIISTSTPGTIGYIAPEYGLTGEVSRMSDVYSFGILLLEIFTRIKPINVNDGEQSLRERILKTYPEALLNIVDDNLMNIGSHSGNTTMHQCISSVIELGLLCSRDSPKERIQMIEVAPRLQKIKAGYLSSSQYISAQAMDPKF